MIVTGDPLAASSGPEPGRHNQAGKLLLAIAALFAVPPIAVGILARQVRRLPDQVERHAADREPLDPAGEPPVHDERVTQPPGAQPASERRFDQLLPGPLSAAPASSLQPSRAPAGPKAGVAPLEREGDCKVSR